jgi:CBS domain-containing protein
MPTPLHAQRLVIYLGESDSWRGRSLYMNILETLRKGGIAGATVTRALAGFGAHSRIRTSTVEVLSTDLPIVISVIDTPENIDRALELVGPMVREGLITRETVEIIKYTHRYLHPLPADHPVSEFMTRNITTVTPDTPARQVAELLLGKLFKAVPVINEQRQVVGIITDGDLLRKAGMPVRLAVGERLEADALQQFFSQISREKDAQTIMTTPAVTVNENDALGHVVQTLMNRNLKRMPVVDGQDRLVGMISRLDILRAVAGNEPASQEQAPLPHAGRTLKELVSTQIPIVHVNDDLADVLQQILRADIKRVIVLDEQEKPIGIITDGDLVARVNPAMRGSVLQVLAARVMGTDVSRGQAIARDFMSEKVLLATEETGIVEAINLMLHEGRKRLVVVDEQGHPIGIVDRQTLMAASLGTSMT